MRDYGMFAVPSSAGGGAMVTGAGGGYPAPEKLEIIQLAEQSHLPVRRTLEKLGNFLRTLATPEPIRDWSLTSLREKLIKIDVKVISHGRYVAFQMAEVAIARQLFAGILRLIAELQSPPDLLRA